MKYLFDQWGEIKKSFPKIFLLLDYDGTLTPIVSRPELAVLSEEMRETVRKVSNRYRTCIVSGRPLAEVRELVGIRKIYYAGNHGFEVSGPGVKLVVPEAERMKPIVARICGEMESELGHILGVIVENKGLTASVHYRLVRARDLGKLKKLFGEIMRPYLKSGAIRITQGKKVFEVRPNIEWDKGKAVLWIIDALDQKRKLTPVYIGDDQTDEDAFVALKNRGITVLVSRRRKISHAKFFLRNVAEVKKFLRRLTSRVVVVRPTRMHALSINEKSLVLSPNK